MPIPDLLDLEIAACDMSFCISRVESSLGICKDKQHFLFLA